MRKRGGFTLIELVMAVFIMMLLLMLAVPSLRGVLADRRLHRSLDGFNALVRQAQERSVAEHQPYLIVWKKDNLVLRPESIPNQDDADAVGVNYHLQRGDVFKITLPAALVDKPAGEWVFWPSGNCEPAVIDYKGEDGAWSATYSALTARPQLTNYAVR